MPFFHFLWTPDAIEHVARHGVTPEEFTEVALSPDYEEKPHRRPNRVAAYGETSNGKYLKVIYDVLEDGISAYPVTAFEEE